MGAGMCMHSVCARRPAMVCVGSVGVSACTQLYVVGLDARMCLGVLCMCVYVRAWTCTHSCGCDMCVCLLLGRCAPLCTPSCVLRG